MYVCALLNSRNTNIAFQHIDVPDNVRDWPWFHNGVAAGLQLGPNDSKVSLQAGTAVLKHQYLLNYHMLMSRCETWNSS